MIVPEIDIPGHASALLVYPEIGSKQGSSTLYSVGRRSGIYNDLNPKTYQLLGEILMKCVRCLPVTTFILAETKTTVKSGCKSYIQNSRKE
jgi:N-acetyl-beta-hexosaminidase